MAKSHIVFQAYGNVQIYRECLFALLSLWEVCGDRMQETEVVVYTDRDDWLMPFYEAFPMPLRSRLMTDREIRQWKGTHAFVHRLKIEMLRDFAAASEGSILYLDTDVFFLRAPHDLLAQIRSGQRCMHVCEGQINAEANPVLRKLHHFLKRKGIPRLNGRRPELTDPPVMWNAGVLGFHTADAAMLDEVLAFTDALYESYPRHVVEQFAFSVYMGEGGLLRPSADYIAHYWNLKEMRLYLDSFFEAFDASSPAELRRLARLVHPQVYLQEKLAFYQNRSLGGKIMRKRWVPGIPDWQLLARQARIV